MPKRSSDEAKLVSRPSKQIKTADTVIKKQDPHDLDQSWLTQHRLPFRDATVGYQADFLNKTQSKELLEALLKLDEWFHPTLKMYGRSFPQSRSVIVYSTVPFELHYSGQSISMSTDWPPVVWSCKEKVEAVLGCTFNHCMLNRYDDGSVHIGKHRDNKENKIIAAVSIGAERDFIMTHDRYGKEPEDADNKDGKVMRKRWTLGDGSLVLMAGQTQTFWKHEIPKQLKIKSPRVSLTFRQMDFEKQ